MYIFVTVYSLPASDSWTYHLCSQMFHESFRVATKTVHSFLLHVAESESCYEG